MLLLLVEKKKVSSETGLKTFACAFFLGPQRGRQSFLNQMEHRELLCIKCFIFIGYKTITETGVWSSVLCKGSEAVIMGPTAWNVLLWFKCLLSRI